MQRYRLPLVREAPIPDDVVLPQPIAYYYLASDVDARIAELERTLGNCRLLAMKRLHKGAIEKADWEAILRFCTEAGCGPSPLRADS